MSTAQNTVVLSLLFFLMFGQSAFANGICKADGYAETVLEAARMGYGEFTSTYPVGGMSVEIITVPATYAVVSREAYGTLSAEMTYDVQQCDKAVMGSRPATISPGRISDYDVIKQADGSEYMRPLETGFQSVNAQMKEYFVVTEPVKTTIRKTKPRPAPELLPGGQLRVMMTPAFQMSRANCYQIVKTGTRRYIKSRTPAVIQRTKCGGE